MSPPTSHRFRRQKPPRTAGRPRTPPGGARTRSSPIFHAPAPPAALVPELASAACRWRGTLFGPFGQEPEIDAYRLIHDAGDGLPGLTVDAYAGHLVVQVEQPAALPLVSPLEKALEKELRPRGIVRKLRYERDGRGRLDEIAATGAVPAALQVRERGLRFEVALQDGLHTGLFTDMREERARLRALAAGRRVLNTFAYTGSLSVAAAAGGAAEVVSVDLVAKPLERARRNFELNGIDPSRHHFAAMEVLEYLRMAHRRGWRFDIILLDPPTFSSSDAGRWSARQEYPELLDRALRLLEPGGLVWVVVNTRSLSAAGMEEMIARAVAASGRRARTLAVSGLPPDYPTPVGQPEARYLKVRVIQL